jgi:hypothetical protein
MGATTKGGALRPAGSEHQFGKYTCNGIVTPVPRVLYSWYRRDEPQRSAPEPAGAVPPPVREGVNAYDPTREAGGSRQRGA